MLSWLATGSMDGYLEGVQELNAAGWPTPPFAISFISFHTMAALGTLFIGMTALGVLLLWRGKLFKTRWFLRALVWSIPLPLLSCQLGWIVAEVGRQPWAVYRLLKTADAFSTNVSGGQILFSIIGFGTIYLLLGALYIYILTKKIGHGPGPHLEKEV